MALYLVNNRVHYCCHSDSLDAGNHAIVILIKMVTVVLMELVTDVVMIRVLKCWLWLENRHRFLEFKRYSTG